MEQKTNIAELLKDAPKGTKLYSPVCGECELLKVNNDDGFIEVQDVDNETLEFFNDGRYFREGECLLFPSKEVRDWSKFEVPKKEQPRFKVGDVVNIISDLWNNNGGDNKIVVYKM